MEKNYSKYTATQLLEDEYFLESSFAETPEDNSFWSKQIENAPWLESEIILAKKFLSATKDASSRDIISDTEVTDLWNRIHNANIMRIRNRRYQQIIRIGSAAAVLLILIISGLIYYSNKPQTSVPDYQSMVANLPEAQMGSNVELVLDNNEKLQLEGDNAKVEYNKNGNVKVNSEELNKEDNVSNETLSFNQLVVPKGRRSTLTLADGTKIWINSGSKLIYPVKFLQNKREIFVEGEIYLEVHHDSNIPFIVKTTQMDIKVLGTRFNVNAYKNETETNVVLVEGKIEVSLENNKGNTILTPDQLFTYNSTNNVGKIKRVDVNDYVAWKEGYYQFHKTSLNIIMKKLSDYYGRVLTCDPIVGEMFCSGKLDLRDSLEDVLINLNNILPLEISENNQNIIKVEPFNN